MSAEYSIEHAHTFHSLLILRVLLLYPSALMIHLHSWTWHVCLLCDAWNLAFQKYAVTWSLIQEGRLARTVQCTVTETYLWFFIGDIKFWILHVGSSYICSIIDYKWHLRYSYIESLKGLQSFTFPFSFFHEEWKWKCLVFSVSEGILN